MSLGPQMPYLILAFSVGLALGVFFSLHLWRSVQRMAESAGHQLASAAGFLLRIAVVTAGFAVVMAGSWERLLAALLGFVVARELMVRSLGRKPGRTQRGPVWRY
ncbi:MAG TPA: ATP synthase subunit I [Deltaproteobacteria bacterium]|nr:ATP synthase subunit I [Deltaproteobacteria bacterium]HQI81784.1 ATP synthase subunit I [Deltaproteobacteria bacterium]